jgi:osomolarity two-component system, sensor histidine kinase SLN1
VISLTLPIVDNSNPDAVLGYMTVVAAATSLLEVTTSRAGLANTGMVLLVSTNRRENLFRYEQRPANGLSNPPYQPAKGAMDTARVKYVFPPVPNPDQSDRHSAYK